MDKATSDRIENKNIYIEKIINDDLYCINSDGSIFAKRLKCGWAKKHYPLRKVDFQKKDGRCYVNYKNKRLLAHRVIYRKFKGKLKSGLVINHIDGNPSNNNIKNLEQVSYSTNLRHSFKVSNRVPSSGNSKINREIAEEIRAKKREGWSLIEIANKYNLSKSSISYIVNYKTWT